MKGRLWIFNNKPEDAMLDVFSIEPSSAGLDTSELNRDRYGPPGGAMIFPSARYGFIRFELNGESDVKMYIPAGRL